MKRAALISILVLYATFLFGQNDVDALRYTYLHPMGSARYSAMGGSFGALGVDPGAVAFNPAGLGLCRTNNVAISTFYGINTAEVAVPNMPSSSDFDYSFKLNSAEIVFTFPLRKDSDIKNFNIGYNYNIINDFNENAIISGLTRQNSLTDWLAQSGNGKNEENLDGFYSNPAYQTYLIDPVPASTNYESCYHGKYGQQQTQTISNSGHQSEHNIVLSLNYNNKLYFGATMAFQNINFKSNKILTETDSDDSVANFKSFEFHKCLTTRGSGMNLKLGLIFAPKEWCRIGLAVHTPTGYELSDSYDTRLTREFNDSSRTFYSPAGSFDYKLVTPLRANASVGFIIKRCASINVDYEFVNYPWSRLRGKTQYAFQQENNDIKHSFRAGHNVKLGAEYNYGPFAFRIGSAFYSSPLVKEHTNALNYTMLYSGGIGFKMGIVYLDFAYTYNNNRYTYFMYQSPTVTSEPAKINGSRHAAIMTLSVKL